MTPVVFETERLRLRWCGAADADSVLALVNDPGWLRFIGDRGVRTRDDAERFILDRLVAGCWRNGFGTWAVERRDGVFVGVCGLVRRDSLTTLDLGYALLPAHRGRGYVREAGAACLAFAARALGERRVLAIVQPENERSLRVLAALGMERLGTVHLAGDRAPVELHVWRAEGAEPATDAARIDALTARFFAAFANRGGAHPAVLTLPHLFAPGAAIAVPDGGRSRVVDVRAFVEPRAELLHGGRLREFAEVELEADTRIAGGSAVRWSRYRKQGVLDGAPFAGTGTKMLTFARTEAGWRIVALAWHDDA